MSNQSILHFIKDLYPTEKEIPLHAPVFKGNEKRYLAACVDSTFVSSVGAYVTEFEKKICEFTGAKYAVATVNGTAALHMALLLAGVSAGDEVLTQALTFVATANAISYLGAQPIFIDSASDNLGMCPHSLRTFLETHTFIDAKGRCVNKKTNQVIKACVPMHVFGHPVQIRQLKTICEEYRIKLVEDAAESLGSYTQEVHTGLIGELGVLSFNGNKIITCGGGGMIITNEESLAKRAKHLTTTAKLPHPYEFFHDEVGYNYRLPNLNAALACAQLEQLPEFLQNKRTLAQQYRSFFSKLEGVIYIDEPEGCQSNFWLNAIQFSTQAKRNEFLKESLEAKIFSRPVWKLMTELPMFNRSEKTDLSQAIKYASTVVNLPSSVR